MNTFTQAINEVFEKHGYIRKSNSWFKRTEEIVVVVNLQKSEYGAQYYLNLGWWLNEFGKNNFPQENKCHVRVRATSVEGAKNPESSLFDLENKNLSEDQRFGLMVKWLSYSIIPLCKETSSRHGLLMAVTSGRFKKGMISKLIKDITGQKMDVCKNEDVS